MVADSSMTIGAYLRNPFLSKQHRSSLPLPGLNGLFQRLYSRSYLVSHWQKCDKWFETGLSLVELQGYFLCIQIILPSPPPLTSWTYHRAGRGKTISELITPVFFFPIPFLIFPSTSSFYLLSLIFPAPSPPDL